MVHAIRGVIISLEKGKTAAIVGESGSGKSTIGRAVIRLYDPTDGKIIFEGKDISKKKLDKETRTMLRHDMQMIFQDPMASLNPRKKVEDIIGEGLDIHHSYKTMEERDEKIKAILKKVGLAPDQAQVVNLMKDIQEETGTALLFIAHDLSMVKYISDRIGVLHLGHMLETGTTDEIFNNPIHPYTRALLSAIPTPNPIVEKKRIAMEYNYKTSGIDYNKGTPHNVAGTHYVSCTDEEFVQWTNDSGHTL